MDRRRFIRGSIPLLLTGLAGCSSGPTAANTTPPPPLDEVDVRIVDVRQPSVGVTSASLPILLEFYNPTNRPVPSPQGEFELYLNGEHVGTSEAALATLDPDETAKDTIDLIIEYSTVGNGVVQAVKDRRIDLRIEGELHSEGVRETFTARYTN